MVDLTQKQQKKLGKCFVLFLVSLFHFFQKVAATRRQIRANITEGSGRAVGQIFGIRRQFGVGAEVRALGVGGDARR